MCLLLRSGRGSCVGTSAATARVVWSVSIGSVFVISGVIDRDGRDRDRDRQQVIAPC